MQCYIDNIEHTDGYDKDGRKTFANLKTTHTFCPKMDRIEDDDKVIFQFHVPRTKQQRRQYQIKKEQRQFKLNQPLRDAGHNEESYIVVNFSKPRNWRGHKFGKKILDTIAGENWIKVTTFPTSAIKNGKTLERTFRSKKWDCSHWKMLSRERDEFVMLTYVNIKNEWHFDHWKFEHENWTLNILYYVPLKCVKSKTDPTGGVGWEPYKGIKFGTQTFYEGVTVKSATRKVKPRRLTDCLTEESKDEL